MVSPRETLFQAMRAVTADAHGSRLASRRRLGMRRRVERPHDGAGARDEGGDERGLGRPEVEPRRQATVRADAGGAIGVDDGVLLGLGKVLEVGSGQVGACRRSRFGRSRRGRRVLDGDHVEPVAGAFHCGELQRGQRLLARRLPAFEGARAALHVTHPRPSPGQAMLAAWARQRWVASGAVPGTAAGRKQSLTWASVAMTIGSSSVASLGGELRLEGIGQVGRRDRGHHGRAGRGRVGGGRWERGGFAWWCRLG
jgi:hypothetical protein